MSPITVFVRTLLKTSAIFIGFVSVMLHPSLEWSSSPPTAASKSMELRISQVSAGQSPREGAVDALVAALKDADAGVRRQAAAALGEIGNTRAVPGLIDPLKDSDAHARQRAISE